MMYNKILVALECKDSEAPLIHEAMRFAVLPDVQFSVIHVNSPSAGKMHMMMDGLPKHDVEDVREFVRKLGYDEIAKNLNIIIRESENFPAEIALATENMDLLIMGHRPKNVVVASIVDSTDERVADKSKCPVLIVPL